MDIVAVGSKEFPVNGIYSITARIRAVTDPQIINYTALLAGLLIRYGEVSVLALITNAL